VEQIALQVKVCLKQEISTSKNQNLRIQNNIQFILNRCIASKSFHSSNPNMSHPSITQQDKMLEKFMKNSTD